jgi:hypothetical protein
MQRFIGSAEFLMVWGLVMASVTCFLALVYECKGRMTPKANRAAVFCYRLGFWVFIAGSVLFAWGYLS